MSTRSCRITAPVRVDVTDVEMKTIKTVTTELPPALEAPLLLGTLEDVKRKTKMSKSWIYREMAANRFPRSMMLAGAARWLMSEVDEWILERVKERDERAKCETQRKVEYVRLQEAK